MLDELAGKRVDRFEVLGLLGKGAMGAVHRARDVDTGREVALKVLLGARLDERQRARFQREGELSAALDHPGIVRVHSTGALPSGVPYLAFELVEGARTLEQARDAEPDLARRVAWVRDAARALGVAHARGIVHRDVKPDNLLVDATGRLKVADFGVAWISGGDRLTRTGAIVGTPQFMSPEQLTDGRAVTAATDVWALGVTLYWLLVDEYPFDAASIGALAAQVVGVDPVAPRAKRPAISRALEAVCLQCLRKDPAARYADGEALAADLDRALGGAPVQAARAGSRVTWYAIAASVGALLVALAAAALAPAPPDAPPLSPVGASRGEVVAAAPVDEYVAVRRALDGTFARPRDRLRALEQALPATPGSRDPALAARLVAAFWPGDDPLLASEAFVLAARLDDEVAQPLGLVEWLESELFSVLTGSRSADVVVALIRLGRLVNGPAAAQCEPELSVRVGRHAGWAEKLALAHVLGEAAYDAANIISGTEAALRRRSLALALEVERPGLPRSARAAARWVAFRQRMALGGDSAGLLRDLPHLMEHADDLDAPAGAFVVAADLALDHGELAAARPFIVGAARAWAERLAAPGAEGKEVRRPSRPWVAPVPPRSGTNDDVDRLQAILRIVDEGADPAALLEPLRGPTRVTVERQLRRLGRTEEAERVREATARLAPRPER